MSLSKGFCKLVFLLMMFMQSFYFPSPFQAISFSKGCGN
jgi:hypothetical protein